MKDLIDRNLIGDMVDAYGNVQYEDIKALPMENEKALYRFYNDCKYVKTLLLTDDQAAVFYWLENLGVQIIIEPVREPEEIRPEDLMKKEND